MHRRSRKQRGLTLIELMIVVAVIAILAALAIPAYDDSVRKARRGQAKADLMALAQHLERCFTVNNTYLAACSGVGANLDFTVAGSDWGRSPRSTAAGAPTFYVISAQTAPAPTASTWVLQAVPQGDQAADVCATLTLTQAGVRGTSSGRTDCW
jgi:type IV pilus assembly protein PilE